MPELTEQQKTILDLFKTNGRRGVHQYLVHEGMTDDEAEVHIDTLGYLPANLEESQNPELIVALATHKEIVTFQDGSTAEIDVTADGTVLNPAIPLMQQADPASPGTQADAD